MSDVPVESPAAKWAWRIGRVVLELAALLLAAAYALMLGFISGWRCDEGCTYNRNYGNPTGVPWKEASDSWQWAAFGVAGAAMLAMVAASIFVVRLKGADSVATWVMLGLTLAIAVFPWLL